MAANFAQFGTAKPETETAKIDGYNIQFTGHELDGDGERKSFYREIPEGDYDFTVYDLEFTESKKGSPMIKVVLQVQAADGEARLTDYLVLTENTTWKPASFLSAVGLWEEAKVNGTSQSLWKKAMKKTGRLTVSHELFNGKNTNRVKTYIKHGSTGVR